jgi:rSAM/selenodomain-associated transferase 1
MRRLLLFGKRPRPGRVKTRLVPLLGERQALALYRAFLTDQLEFLRQFDDLSPVWCVDGELDAQDRELPLETIEIRQQGQGDLGRRMERAFHEARDAGSQATVVMGADSPTLPAAHVVSAFSRLRSGAEVVLSAAEDGGYVLLGLTEPRRELFRKVPWGTSKVAAVTRQRAEQERIRLVEIEPWYDVDDASALRRLRAELSDARGRARAPATARALLDLPLEPVI